MPGSAADSRRAGSPLETPEAARSFAAPPPNPPPPGCGIFGIADTATAATLPPAITPATTTRQSVSLGVLSTLWGELPPASSVSSAPAVVTHAPAPDVQEALFDLATSTGSVPSATTTLTNTLPPTQSAALRALNAPAFQSLASSSAKSKPAKSASSRTTLSSQPVVVRTYSGSRNNSRNSSGLNSPRHSNMSGHPSQNPSALSAGLAGRTETLPSVEDFSFSAILRAVDPEIRDAIDAIAEICARSRMSLADEYDAHLPPQGEITDTGPVWAAGVGALVGRGRITRVSQGWTAAENTLTAVPEASSSSERLAGEVQSTRSSRKGSQSAYGSLKSVISGGSAKRKTSHQVTEHGEAGPFPPTDASKPPGPAWAVNVLLEDHPVITVPSPQASNQLSLDSSSTIKDIPEAIQSPSELCPSTAIPKTATAHRRNTSLTSSVNTPRARTGTLSSITSWLPWPRPSHIDTASQQDLTKAETRLREVLMVAQSSALGKGKMPLSVS